VLPASTQTTRNTIPNAAKKEKKRIIGIPPLRFQEYQMGVNCGRKGNDVAHLEEITLEKSVRSTVNKKLLRLNIKEKIYL